MEKTIDTILRQRKAGKKEGLRYICKECDFIFVTDTFRCTDQQIHSQETGHDDYYDVPLKNS